jgi:coenzyme F420-0:L-glutamate ligase/coenzyme F420-1:gamma-L-glutamate ligase
VTLTIIPIEGIGEIGAGDEIADIIATAAAAQKTPLTDGDCVVITQKVVSKAEDRIVDRADLVITETAHGFVCANAGIDLSNVPAGRAALLPVDPDRSARHVRDALRARHGVDVAIVVSDTFGRAWRHGLTDVAIGIAGIAGVVDLRGALDAGGRELQVTEVAIADEIAGAAELVMGKATGVPAAIVRGIDAAWRRDATARELVRSPPDDLFR